MEIGTYDGKHALEMIQLAKKFHGNQVEYYGFDLFGMMNNAILEKEAAKQPITRQETLEKLGKTKCKITLFKGFTRKSLPQNINKLPKMDLIFIDGGHSIQTIQNDWLFSQKLMHQDSIVVFDDYWNRDKAGCKTVIRDIDRSKYRVEILPITDWFLKPDGILKINMVMVSKNEIPTVK